MYLQHWYNVITLKEVVILFKVWQALIKFVTKKVWFVTEGVYLWYEDNVLINFRSAKNQFSVKKKFDLADLKVWLDLNWM
jgi:hypothetical protein